ncbi:MAG: hypothetical protein JW924_03245 [Fusobacteriaceae bacterium]|nr:hypothetical protein [Fusobacteriaceae bacterium]
MKYKEIKSKFQKLFRGNVKNQNEIEKKSQFDQLLYPHIPTNLKSIIPIYESDWIQMTPTLPDVIKYFEIFDTTDGNPAYTIKEDDITGSFSTYEQNYIFEDLWRVKLIPQGGYPNNVKSVDFNFNVKNGGSDFFEKRYKCTVDDWEGWEHELDENGNCPVDGKPVIVYPNKYFTSHNGFCEDNHSVVGQPTFANLNLYLNQLSISGIPLKKDYQLKIDSINFNITANIGNDVIIQETYCCGEDCYNAQDELDALKANTPIGGNVIIDVILYPGFDIRYYYPVWTSGEPSQTNVITLTNLDNFNRNLFEDYKTIYGDISEETWKTYSIYRINIHAGVVAQGVVAKCVSDIGIVVGGYTDKSTVTMDFDIDNISIYDASEQLIPLNYEIVSNEFIITESSLPFVRHEILTKIESSQQNKYFLADEDADLGHQKNVFINVTPKKSDEHYPDLYKMWLKGQIYMKEVYPDYLDISIPQAKLLMSLMPPYNFQELQTFKLPDEV